MRYALVDFDSFSFRISGSWPTIRMAYSVCVSNVSVALALHHFLLFRRCRWGIRLAHDHTAVKLALIVSLLVLPYTTFCMVTLLRKFPRLRPCRPNGQVFQFLIRWKTIFIFSFSILSSKISPKEHLQIINFAIRILYQITISFFLFLNCQIAKLFSSAIFCERFFLSLLATRT